MLRGSWARALLWSPLTAGAWVNSTGTPEGVAAAAQRVATGPTILRLRDRRGARRFSPRFARRPVPRRVT